MPNATLAHCRALCRLGDRCALFRVPTPARRPRSESRSHALGNESCASPVIQPLYWLLNARNRRNPRPFTCTIRNPFSNFSFSFFSDFSTSILWLTDRIRLTAFIRVWINPFVLVRHVERDNINLFVQKLREFYYFKNHDTLIKKKNNNEEIKDIEFYRCALINWPDLK